MPSSGNQQQISGTTQDSSDATQFNPGSTFTRVRQPKLRFDSELTAWMPFWDSYESAIHNSADLFAVDKFNYLQSLLEGPAADAIAGLTLSSPNYTEAIAILLSMQMTSHLVRLVSTTHLR